MIRKLYSPDLASFKTLTFKPGLNVLVAEKSPDATDKHTRNRAGKSSMVELVHFLLGSDADKDSLFRNEALANYRFGMEFELGGQIVEVQRIGSKASPLTIEGEFSDWPLQPKPKNQSHIISNTHWKIVLAKMMFDLRESDGAWTPSFRSLIAYFMRRERNGGFHEPIKQNSKQQLVDQQVNLSFLLGLDWSVAHGWQAIRDREKSLKQLKKSMKDGAFGAIVDKASVLKSQLIVAQARVERLKADVTSFRVLEEYHELEQEASELTRQLSVLADENVVDRRYLLELKQSTIEEVPPTPADLGQLYAEAGVVLPDVVKKRYEDVQTFHESVIRNRQSYLQSESEQTRRRMTEREQRQERMDQRRAEVMGILKSTGALEQFTALQGELARAKADVEALRQRYDAAEALESGSLKLQMERNILQTRLREDYSEQSVAVEDAILTFQQISASLYEVSKAGHFTMTPTDNGPEFSIEIQGSKSRGVNNMQIFCFDMMLTLLTAKHQQSPGFLIHDSHLFDGVDERQVGKALALGAQMAEQHGFQYIVTLNTDDLPQETPEGFDLEDHMLPSRLSDSSENGGLFGFRFE